jgi:alpha-galactosidase
MKPLEGGDKAVALFNRSEAEYPITVDFKSVGFDGPVHARDLWSQKDLGNLNDSYTAVVPKHGVVMLRLSK